jgi:hypothetical protein
MTDSGTGPSRIVPPGSTPLRELCHAINRALTLPRSATLRDELVYLRVVRDRARLVRHAAQRLAADREASDDDVMTSVAILRAETGQLGDDAPGYEPAPEPEPEP